MGKVPPLAEKLLSFGSCLESERKTHIPGIGATLKIIWATQTGFYGFSRVFLKVGWAGRCEQIWEKFEEEG